MRRRGKSKLRGSLVKKKLKKKKEIGINFEAILLDSGLMEDFKSQFQSNPNWAKQFF